MLCLLFQDQQNNICPLADLDSGVMQDRHKAYKEFNLKIDLEIAAQINRHKV